MEQEPKLPKEEELKKILTKMLDSKMLGREVEWEEEIPHGFTACPNFRQDFSDTHLRRK